MVQVTCPRCATPFETTNLRRRYCRKDCGRPNTSRNAARTQAREVHSREFVGVDGEGVTDPVTLEHRYVMFSIGDETITAPEGGRLTIDDVFTFLWDHSARNPTAVYVGFFLGYDFAQWLRTLPEERARMLLTKAGKAVRARKRSGNNRKPFPVGWGEWEFDLLGMKRLTLGKKGDKRRVYINDSGSFFQCSFLKAIDPRDWHNPIVTPAEYAIIEEGKTGRSTAVASPEMARYNTLENDVLARIMTHYNVGLSGYGIRLAKDQWYGPGQAAQRWMSTVGAPRREDVEEIVPDAAREAARMAYFGGWFEIMRHGTIPGTVWEYDINSAYPTVIRTLPCLLHGDWNSGAGTPPDGPYVLVHATVRGSDPVTGPMPHRSTAQRILRPHRTRGWFWLHELRASHAAGLADVWEVDEWISYTPCPCPPPMRSIEDLYQTRLAVGKKTPEGKALKLVYNSTYGKTAQSIGHPVFANSVYASLTTSGCRTQILWAIATHPERSRALVMVATDAVYFTSPHPGLTCSEELGEWDDEVHENLTLFMPGVYWSDKHRAVLAAGELPQVKSRGISSSDLARVIGEIDRQFDEQARALTPTWPRMTIPIAFSMISPLQALARNKWELCGTLQRDPEKTIDSDPTNKRLWLKIGFGLETIPYPEADTLDSVPYDKMFGEELREFNDLEEYLTPDWNTVDEFAKMLKVD